MNKQRKRNIRLLITLVVVVTISLSWTFISNNKRDSLDINRGIFKITNTLDISKIVSTGTNSSTELKFLTGKWLLNNEFEADPSRVHLLFAAIQNMSVRRPISIDRKNSIDSLFLVSGVKLSFFNGESEIAKIETCGDERLGITYFRKGSDTFIMEIPGYRTYIHGLIAFETEGWRNMNLFHKMGWRNLRSIDIQYPETPQNNFSISRNKSIFGIDQLEVVDTTRLFDYIDYISLINTEHYLPDTFNTELKPSIKITVTDVGNRSFIMELFNKEIQNNTILGRMDSSNYFTLGKQQFESLLLSPAQFEK